MLIYLQYTRLYSNNCEVRWGTLTHASFKICKAFLLHLIWCCLYCYRFHTDELTEAHDWPLLVWLTGRDRLTHPSHPESTANFAVLAPSHRSQWHCHDFTSQAPSTRANAFLLSVSSIFNIIPIYELCKSSETCYRAKNMPSLEQQH